MVRGAHAREHQELRRADRARGEDDLAGGLRLLPPPAAPVADTRRSRPVEDDAGRLRVGEHGEVAAALCRLQVIVGRAAAQASALRDPHEAGALQGFRPEIPAPDHLRLLDRLKEGLRHRVRVGQRGDRAGLLLHSPQIRLQVLPPPPFRPRVEVGAIPGDPHHRVHRRGAAQDLAAREVDAAAVEPVLRDRLVPPVELRLEELGECGRDADLLGTVPRPRLQQQDGRRGILTQSVGECAACGSGADDDVVESLRHVPTLWPAAPTQ